LNTTVRRQRPLRTARHCGKADCDPRNSRSLAATAPRAGTTATGPDRDASHDHTSRARLHLARRWLDLDLGPYDADASSTPAQAHDRTVFAWSAAAAVRGDPQAQVLLGRCFAAGRGIAKNFASARKWFQRAADAGNTEAQYRLRALRLERRGWLQHRQTLIGWVGLCLLLAHAATHGVHVDPLGVLAYLGLSIAALSLILIWGAIERRPDPGPDYVFDRQVDTWLRRPWRIAWVATEDGAFLAPLLWLGVTPWSAALAGALFGLAHYPSFRARACALKGLEHAFIALLLLPFAGLWSIVVGHIVWDAALLGLGAWSRRRRQPSAYASARQPG
jgi:hypothetical protein